MNETKRDMSLKRSIRLYAGTSGYSYKEWIGSFYPKDLPNKNMLRFYGDNLPAVEINNTFYRMPSASVLQAWAEQVPPGFRFVLKAPRKITHIKPLKEKRDEVGYFIRTAATLGDKLGAILFQLPPYLHINMGLFAGFTDLLPSEARVAFEFRHRSWFDDELYELLQTKGYAVCCSDSENQELSQFVSTADWGYVRLRKPNYSEQELLDWIQKIKSQSWQAAFAFFKHEDGAAGPKLARHFIDLAGRVNEPTPRFKKHSG
jgi:uncharacterized protein YecE (DUF72 family)